MEPKETKFNIDEQLSENSEIDLNFLRNHIRLKEDFEKLRSKTKLIHDCNELSDAFSILSQQMEGFDSKPIASALVVEDKEEQDGENYFSGEAEMLYCI